MIEQASNWLQSVFVVGKPLFPYLGLVLLVIVAALVVALLLYFLYRIARRLPTYARYLFWRVGVVFRRLAAFVRRDPAAGLTVISAAFGGADRRMAMVDSFRANDARWWQGRRAVAQRPDEPLLLLLGPDKAGKSTFVAQAENSSARLEESGEAGKSADVVWWRTTRGWMLEVSDALAGEPGGAKFGKMLEILRRMRPERPLDGIVMLLPANRLVTRGGYESWLAVYAENSVRIGAEFGYRLPLYVIVSRADVLPGFSSLAELSANLGQSDEALGSDFASQEYSPTIAACIGRLREQVENATLNALLSQNSWSRNFRLRDVSGLAEQIACLRPALSLAFQKARIFGDTSALPLPQLRAVFLCGLLGERSGNTVAELASWPRLAFARKLLEERLFLTEEALAPCAARVAETRKQRRTVTAAAACAGLLLWGWGIHTAIRIRDNVDANIQVLRSLEGELRIARQASASPTVADAPVLEKVLLSSAELDRRPLRFVLAPTSWFSGHGQKIQAAVGEVAQRLLLGPFVERLAHEAPRLPAESPASSAAGVAAYRLEDLPSYRALVEFLDAREQVFRLVETGDKIAARKRLSYGGLVGFLGYQPEQFKRLGIDWASSMPDAVVEKFRPVGLLRQEAEGATRQALEAHWERMLREALDLQPAVILADDIAEAAHRLSSGGAFPLQDAEQLGENLKRLKREVEAKGARRVLGNEVEAQAFFSAALLRVSGSPVVPIGQSVDLGSALKSRVQAIRGKLAQKEVEGVGTVFASDSKDAPLVLSAEAKRFLSAYALFARQSFLQPARDTAALSPAHDQYIEWSLPDLERLRELIDAYKDFSTNGSLAFEPRLRAGLQRVARANYERVALSVLKESAHLRSRVDRQAGTENLLRSLSAQVSNLSAAARLYRAAMMSEEGRAEAGEGAEILAREARQALAQLEGQLMIDDPLSSLGLDVARWLRSAPAGASLAATMRADPKERLLMAREYLRAQYAAMAGSLLDILDGAGRAAGSDEATVRWKRLRYALDATEKGGLNNSVQEFERYVLALDKLGDADKCERFVGERQRPVLPDDYFSRALGALDNAVALSCEQRLADARQRRYEDFAGWFNTVAAGRLPFIGEKDGSAGPPLSVAAFRRVLGRYQEFRGRKDAAMEKNAWTGEVGDFIARMDNLVALFLVPPLNVSTASSLASGGGNAARRDESASELPIRGKIRFRPKREEERGAEQIIDWSVGFGTRRYTQRSGEPAFEWRPGEPVEIRLRWAADSTVAPIALPLGARNLSIGEKTAVFRYADNWALLELIRRHRQRTAGGDNEVLLSFTIPTVGAQERQEAQVHIALAPSDQGGDVFPFFPAEAPRIEAAWPAGKP